MIQSGDVKAAQEAPRYRGRGPIIAPIITQAGPVAQLNHYCCGLRRREQASSIDIASITAEQRYPP